MNISITKTNASEILSSEYFELIKEYSAESSINGMPSINAKLALYQQIEQSGTLCSYGAYLNSKLIGFVTILTTIVPHYGAKVSTIESIFVGKQHRKAGAGALLRRKAAEHAKNQGAIGILTCAPVGSDYAKLLSKAKSGYRHTNEVFFRSFINE